MIDVRRAAPERRRRAKRALGTGAVAGVLGLVFAHGAAAQVAACTPHWRMFASKPVPPLSAVAAVSARDVWAVGGVEGGISGPAVSKPVIVHWDGRKLTTTRFALREAAFAGVSASGPADVWTVGSVGSRPLVAHWDGRHWLRMRMPRLRYGAGLEDVVALAPDDVWAVGSGGVGFRPLVLHWNGRHWRAFDLRAVVPSDTQLVSVDARSSSDVWAAGADYQHAPVTFGYTDLVIHWNGHRWRQVSSPLANEAETGPLADALDVGLAGDVWTVNSDFSGNPPYLVRWSGLDHRRATVFGWNRYISQSINDIAAISAASVWAVGELDYRTVRGRIQSADTPLIVHWNGKNWTPQSTPFAKFRNLPLNGVFALSATEIWAVGRRIIVHYAC